jgi:hypothetical protein
MISSHPRRPDGRHATIDDQSTTRPWAGHRDPARSSADDAHRPHVLAADRVWASPRMFHARRTLAGYRLVATDTRWAAGQGQEVIGRIGALLLRLTGRPAALAQLSGPGAARLHTGLPLRNAPTPASTRSAAASGVTGNACTAAPSRSKIRAREHGEQPGRSAGDRDARPHRNPAPPVNRGSNWPGRDPPCRGAIM